MNSATTAAAVQYRLKEWAAQIRECQNRPAGMSVVDWCASHGITKADYYYRLRRVRQVCLENLPPETPAQQISVAADNVYGFKAGGVIEHPAPP